ncbi:MAG: hypothetical protein PHE54_05145 [Bacilli bacterium]|nr:hypothetical protein [Bacilli bacterium]
MVLIYIVDENLRKQVITYLEFKKILITTNINSEYDYILIGQFDKKTAQIVDLAYNKKRKILVLLYSIESKIITIFKNNNVKHKKKRKDILSILEKSTTIITSLPIYKQIIQKYVNTSIVILEKELNPLFNVRIKMNKRCLLLFYPKYQDVKEIIAIIDKYPNYHITLIGYRDEHLLNSKLKQKLNQVNLIKNYNEAIFTKECKKSSLIIYNSNQNEDINYLNIVFLLKKKVIIKKHILFNDYLINSLNAYLYNDECELLSKMKKMIDNRIADMSLESYELIKNRTFDIISNKLSNYVK